MSEPAVNPAPACAGCLRRSWLLARLGTLLDYRCSDVPRLLSLLALDDDSLLDALAGRRSAALRSEYLRFDPSTLPGTAAVETICRHDPGYPDLLREPGAPPMLFVLGAPSRLRQLTRGPKVAVVGSRRASDYGVEVARSLGRGLAASGVTVVSGSIDGIALAAHSGSLEAGGASMAVVVGGLDLPFRPRARSMLERLTRTGCATSELPCGVEGRRWGAAAATRIVVGLAEVTVIVEAEDSPRELGSAAMARALGRTVAAVPGRVTSRSSSGTNALLMDGALLVRGPRDVLELLPAASTERAGEPVKSRRLEPRLARVLDRVGQGRDTPDELIREGGDVSDVLLALSELELMGVLRRGDGGRYVPRL
jgi:DNA processing protein